MKMRVPRGAAACESMRFDFCGVRRRSRVCARLRMCFAASVSRSLLSLFLIARVAPSGAACSRVRLRPSALASAFSLLLARFPRVCLFDFARASARLRFRFCPGSCALAAFALSSRFRFRLRAFRRV
jgi:hypothetical protein